MPVRCQLCDREFGLISASHLKYKHNEMTMAEYREMFPDVPIVSPEVIRKPNPQPIKYTIICPGCGKKKTFEKKSPSHYERKFCCRSCGISCSAKQLWADPDYRDKQSKASKKVWENPEYRAKRTKKRSYMIICLNCGKENIFDGYPDRQKRQFCNQSCAATYLNKQTWADPEVRARRIKGITEQHNTEEYRKNTKASWTDERRETAAERARKYLPITIHQPDAYDKMCKTKRDKEHRELAKQQALERWGDPEFHSRAIEILKETHNTLEYREAASKRARERWEDPIQGAKWAKAMQRRPTKPELALLEILKQNGYQTYIYTGDGSFLVGRKNPDFVCFEDKTIIEMFGVYWHNEDEIGPRTEYFAQRGFRTLIIWDYELNDTEQLLTKLKEFHQGIKLIEYCDNIVQNGAIEAQTSPREYA